VSLDIRVPIGLLFLALGGLLVGFGAVTNFTNPGIYEKSLDININVWWGLAMVLFGGLMFYFGRRAVRRSAPTEP